MSVIDLNADLGEGDAFDVELLQVVSSCNVACGGHTGDAQSMAATVALAIANNVAIGAHPAYPDRAGFGRVSRFLAGGELKKSLINQLDMITKIAGNAGQRIAHVKPHGALYVDAATSEQLAGVVVQAVQTACPGAAIMGPPQGELRAAATAAGLRYIAEAFVDRAYRADGSLLPRSKINAVHADLNTITTQAVRLALGKSISSETGAQLEVQAQSLCIHGDTPNAGEIARAVRDVLVKSGVTIRVSV